MLERDIGAANLMRKYGYKAYYGDATQVELLRSAGARKRRESIVMTCNEPEDTMKLVALCQQHFLICIFCASAWTCGVLRVITGWRVTQFSRETLLPARWNWDVKLWCR